MRGLRGRHEKKDRERERKKCRWPASLQGVCCPANITSTPLTWTGPACCLNSFVVPRCIAAKQPICKLTMRCICTACGVVACLRLRCTPSCNAQHKHVQSTDAGLLLQRLYLKVQIEWICARRRYKLRDQRGAFIMKSNRNECNEMKPGQRERAAQLKLTYTK